VSQNKVPSQIVDTELHNLTISLSLLLTLQLSDALYVLFVYKLNARHQARGSGVDQYGQADISKLGEGNLFAVVCIWCELNILLHYTFIIILNRVLASESASANRVITKYVRNQTPLLSKQSIVPVD